MNTNETNKPPQVGGSASNDGLDTGVYMTNKIDWCCRLRDLASGKLNGEIPSIEYALAADEIERLKNQLTKIVNLSDGWSDDGSTGQKKPFSWETVARVAMDYARSALVSNGKANRAR